VLNAPANDAVKQQTRKIHTSTVSHKNVTEQNDMNVIYTQSHTVTHTHTHTRSHIHLSV